MGKSHYTAVCDRCGAAAERADHMGCSRCGGALSFRYPTAELIPDDRYGTTMWRFWRRLPFTPDTDLVTLSEGGTPLHRSRGYGTERQVWFKDETRNPTASHKDRALALGVNHARRVGARASIVVSAGSTGLAHAAYAARARIPGITLVSSGTPRERTFALQLFGSRLVEVNASIDEIIVKVDSLASEAGIYVNSTTRMSNPYQAEASKTIAYEIVEQTGDAPHWMVVPIGGGGTVAGIWRGFEECHAGGWASRVPRLIGVVPSTHDALKRALREGARSLAEVKLVAPESDMPTILTKIAHVVPPDGAEALAAIRASDGWITSVTDRDALNAQARIARGEGIYVEPSSATVIAGLDQVVDKAARDEIVVGLLCGSGFRETFVSMREFEMALETCTLAGIETAIERILG